MLTLWHQALSLLPFESTSYVFMQDALLAVLLMAPAFALLGCLVISNQMAFFSDAIGHAALTGLAIGVLARCADPIVPMVAFAVLLTLLVAVFRRYSTASTDTVIGIVMASSVALGITLLSRQGGFHKYTRYLVGDVLTVTPAEMARMAVLLVIVLAAWILFFNRLLLVWLNRSIARSRGIAVATIETLFTLLVAVCVTVSISWVGLMVINSMLILPAAAARNLARSTRAYLAWSVSISIGAGIAGLFASYYWATATGATIVLFSTAAFVVSLFFRRG